MFTRIMHRIEAFIANSDSWTLLDYALVAAFVWTILSFGFVFYESLRRMTVSFISRRQSTQGKKGEQEHEETERLIESVPSLGKLYAAYNQVTCRVSKCDPIVRSRVRLK